MKYILNPQLIKLDVRTQSRSGVGQYSIYKIIAEYMDNNVIVESDYNRVKEYSIKQALERLEQEVFYQYVINNVYNNNRI